MPKDLSMPDTYNILESFVSGEIQKDRYFDAVENSNVPDIDDILGDTNRYKDIIDEKNEISARYLVASIFVLSGKTGDDYYKLGKTYHYFKTHEKWKQLGYEDEHEFINDSPYGKSYFDQAMTAFKLVQVGRLTREDLILLGSKVRFLASYRIEELEPNQLYKLIKKLIKIKKFEDANNFIKSGDYKYFLAGEKPPSALKEIPLSGSPGKKYEFIQINIKMPRLQSKRNKDKGFYTEFPFEDDWDQQVWNLAYQKCKNKIAEEMQNIYNDPSYARYKKQAIKKYGKKE